MKYCCKGFMALATGNHKDFWGPWSIIEEKYENGDTIYFLNFDALHRTTVEKFDELMKSCKAENNETVSITLGSRLPLNYCLFCGRPIKWKWFRNLFFKHKPPDQSPVIRER